MKFILLIRHSEPIKDRTIPTEELPLSKQGHIKAQEFFSADVFVLFMWFIPLRIDGHIAPQKN